MYSRRIAVGLRDGFSALETRALSRRERTSCSSPAGARAGREDVVGPAGVALVGSSSFPSRALALDVLLQSQWCALQELVAGRRAAEGRHLTLLSTHTAAHGLAEDGAARREADSGRRHGAAGSRGGKAVDLRGAPRESIAVGSGLGAAALGRSACTGGGRRAAAAAYGRRQRAAVPAAGLKFDFWMPIFKNPKLHLVDES